MYKKEQWVDVKQITLFYFQFPTMTTEIDLFKKLSWKDKIQYMIGFYQKMSTTTHITKYIDNFQQKINTIQSYQENIPNTKRIISMYEHIILARAKTKQQYIEKTKNTIKSYQKKFIQTQTNIDKEDLDEKLADALQSI
jgi:hypothetical protein